MSDNHVAGARVVAVLLADGWHEIVPGSFRVGPLSFEAGAGPGTPGFRFEEADAGRPYQPTALAGPLDSVIAVRQVSPAVRRVGHQDLPQAANHGQRADQGARWRVHAGQAAAQGQGKRHERVHRGPGFWPAAGSPRESS
jgi:hypothetical protein